MSVPEQDPQQGQEIPVVVVPGDYTWLERWLNENGLGGDDGDGFAPGPEGARCRAEWLRSRGRPSDATVIAEAVARLLRSDPPSIVDPRRLLSAAEVAARFAVGAEWIRLNADSLGVVRMGDGPRPRLRFDLDTVTQALAARSVGKGSETQERQRPRARRRAPDGRTGTGVELLPIHAPEG